MERQREGDFNQTHGAQVGRPAVNDIGFCVKRPFSDFGDLKRPCKIGRRFDRSEIQLWEKKGSEWGAKKNQTDA